MNTLSSFAAGTRWLCATIGLNAYAAVILVFLLGLGVLMCLEDAGADQRQGIRRREIWPWWAAGVLAALAAPFLGVLIVYDAYRALKAIDPYSEALIDGWNRALLWEASAIGYILLFGVPGVVAWRGFVKSRRFLRFRKEVRKVLGDGPAVRKLLANFRDAQAVAERLPDGIEKMAAVAGGDGVARVWLATEAVNRTVFDILPMLSGSIDSRETFEDHAYGLARVARNRGERFAGEIAEAVGWLAARHGWTEVLDLFRRVPEREWLPIAMNLREDCGAVRRIGIRVLIELAEALPDDLQADFLRYVVPAWGKHLQHAAHRVSNTQLAELLPEAMKTATEWRRRDLEAALASAERLFAETPSDHPVNGFWDPGAIGAGGVAVEVVTYGPNPEKEARRHELDEARRTAGEVDQHGKEFEARICSALNRLRESGAGAASAGA